MTKLELMLQVYSAELNNMKFQFETNQPKMNEVQIEVTRQRISDYQQFIQKLKLLQKP